MIVSLSYSVMRTRHAIVFFFMTQQPLVYQGLLIFEASRPHSDTPHSVGLFWSSYQPDAENSAWQHTTITTDRHPYPGGIRTHNPSKRAALDPHLRPRMPQLRCRFLRAKHQVRSQNFPCGYVSEQIQLGQVCSVYLRLFLWYYHYANTACIFTF
jgi:hypothetical protein